MPKTFDGGCQCGNFRYRLIGKIESCFVCHCHSCQKQSSSAFGMGLWVRKERLDILSGELKTWLRVLRSGGEMICQFCPECGTRVFHVWGKDKDVVSIKPGTLDDTSWIKPAAHLWTDSMQLWVKIPDGCLVFSGNPKDWQDIVKRTNEMLG